MKFKAIWKEAKIEIIFCGFIILISCIVALGVFHFENIRDYFYQEGRIGSIESLLGILFGLYLGICTFFMTSTDKITEYIIKEGQQKQFIVVLMKGLILTFVTLCLSIFCISINDFFLAIFIGFLFVNLYSLIDFVRLLIGFFKVNFKFTEEKIEKEEEKLKKIRDEKYR